MKNVVITGSTRGIGYAMAREFLQAGCNVTLSGRGEALPKSAHDELKSLEGKYIYVQSDVQQRASLQQLWDASITRWGSVDIWINNAGQNAPYLFAWETGASYTENVINTNVVGMIYGSLLSDNAPILHANTREFSYYENYNVEHYLTIVFHNTAIDDDEIGCMAVMDNHYNDDYYGTHDISLDEAYESIRGRYLIGVSL